MRYHSTFKIQALVERAVAELDQEELKVFLLAWPGYVATRLIN